jgi:dihydropteroate synthase
MAVLNLTPDSFSDGGAWHRTDGTVDLAALLREAEAALSAGVDILDIGAESTRPGACEVPWQDELARLLPSFEALRAAFPAARLSVDTRKARVAQAVLAAGANLVNDVSGLSYQGPGGEPEAMAELLAHTEAGYVLMHTQGPPETMQHQPTYHNVLAQVQAFLQSRTQLLLDAGVSAQKIIWDPGFGFGKTVAHNLRLLAGLETLAQAGYPILVGTSRKSFLTLGQGQPPPSQREALTSASLALALANGATLLRIHDWRVQLPVVAFVKACLENRPETAGLS